MSSAPDVPLWYCSVDALRQFDEDMETFSATYEVSPVDRSQNEGGAAILQFQASSVVVSWALYSVSFPSPLGGEGWDKP